MTSASETSTPDLRVRSSVLLGGFGLTNRAVAKALVGRGHTVLAFDDKPSELLRGLAGELGVELLEPSAKLDKCLDQVDFVVPTPGLAEHHSVFEQARRRGLPLVSELDLAAQWDERPVVAITGTNGKTTVVELCTDALKRSGTRAVAAGNTDVPLVEAIRDPSTEVFVVEASSFRLAHTREFTPQVAAWLNFAPDHLDVHLDLASYEKAKSRIWRNLATDGVCVANALDPVVMRHVRPDLPAVTFGGGQADWRAAEGELIGPQGPFAEVADLWRALPHDIEAALAAAASVTPVGATLSAVAEACHEFDGLPHRIAPVGEIDGSVYYDDSKATTPHATLAALRGFGRVVLIAGGQNKGVDLAEMALEASGVVGVVAIGDASGEIADAFSATHLVEVAADMDDAVIRARRLAAGGVPVLLSPGCASFDWYESYKKRGEDFIRAVGAQR
ncbi:MAG: UDP-N-acetylmuramoyl-L-alanine--D-glutamate ligase [Acidimicrobiaceae bacterium]|nr:UDP-N-acetylmuramoyl-L-alanine--D-glutamate ligase [Acidimicrobiaceae bacterium]